MSKKLVEKLTKDPVFFVKDVLGCVPWDKQAEIIQSVRDNQRTTVRSCTGSGKSYIAASTALWFLYSHYPSTVITTAPTYRQVRDILWREISARYINSKYRLGGSLTETRLDIEPQWFAIGLSTDEPERFQGIHNRFVLVIVDEASGVPEGVFEALGSLLSAGECRLLLIGNPTQVLGTFYNSFTSDASSLYHQFHISAYDTPNFTTFGITEEDMKSGAWKEKVGKYPFPSLITPEWVADRLVEWRNLKRLYDVYVLGNFPEGDIDALFKLVDIEMAGKRDLKAEGQIVAGVDVSRYGDDETVVVVRQGDKVLHLESWGHQDTVFSAGRVANVLRKWKPVTARVDSVGVGAGVADQLRANGLSVEAVNVGEQALESERFINKRAEFYWLLAQRFADGKISIPENQKLKTQLCGIKYEWDNKTRLKIESKENAKKRGMQSPDYADALMLAFAPLSARKLIPVSTW